jgi:hypothetical protein
MTRHARATPLARSAIRPLSPARPWRFRWAPGSIALRHDRARRRDAVADDVPALQMMARATIAGDKRAFGPARAGG